MPAVRQQAWDLLIARHAIQSEFAKVGIEVTDDELVDMISGTNLDPSIKQAFTNPETGEFDRTKIRYLHQSIKDDATKLRCQSPLGNLSTRPEAGRERIKYENLLIKSNYITTC
jgi:peptidyl-prolyl cis-trans isomerase D